MHSDIVEVIIKGNHSHLPQYEWSMKVSTMKPHVHRYLHLARLSLKQAFKGLSASRVKTSDSPFSVSPCLRGGCVAASRFFFIVVEIQEENKELIRLMQVNPSVAAAVHLPEGCRF